MEHSGKPQLEIAEQETSASCLAVAARDPFMRFLVTSAANKDEREIPRVRKKNNLLFTTRTSVVCGKTKGIPADSTGARGSIIRNSAMVNRDREAIPAIDNRPACSTLKRGLREIGPEQSHR